MAFNSSTVYEYKFISEPDDGLTCRICFEVARDPWQHGKCGMLFCKECLEKHGRHKACPNCRERWPQYFEDNRSKRDIKALHVRCDNVERGCKWEGTVGTLDDHVTKVCQFTPVPCPNKCKVGSTEEGITFQILRFIFGNKTKHIMKKDLEEHLMNECPNREYQCEYCGKKGTYVSITEEHDKICEKKIVPCTNTGCTMTMERGKVEAHVANDCEYTEISCKYESIGCDVKMKRRDMRDHEEDNKVHLDMALDTIVELKKTTDVVEGRSNMKLESVGSMTFKLTDYQERKDGSECFSSPSFYTSPTGYHLFLRVYPNGDRVDGAGTHVSVYACIIKGKYDEKLKWPLIGNISIEILNQLENNNHYNKDLDLTAEDDTRHGGKTSWGYPQFIPHSELSRNLATNTQYLKDNTLYFRVSVEVSDHKPWLECTA